MASGGAWRKWSQSCARCAACAAWSSSLPAHSPPPPPSPLPPSPPLCPELAIETRIRISGARALRLGRQRRQRQLQVRCHCIRRESSLPPRVDRVSRVFTPRSSAPASSFPDDQGHPCFRTSCRAPPVSVTRPAAAADHLKETLLALDASVRWFRGGADPALALHDLQHEASSGSAGCCFSGASLYLIVVCRCSIDGGPPGASHPKQL